MQEMKTQKEIESAMNSLKTNLILSVMYLLFSMALPVVNVTVSMVVLSLLKSVIPILTTISNFRKIKELLSFSCLRCNAGTSTEDS
jgi:hypothetical protein